MPFATIAPISVGKDKDMVRACDAFDVVDGARSRQRRAIK
jgi:hypothetical protein